MTSCSSSLPTNRSEARRAVIFLAKFNHFKGVSQSQELNCTPASMVSSADLSKDDEGFIKLPESNSHGGGSVNVNNCSSTDSEDDSQPNDCRVNEARLINKFEHAEVTLGATTTSGRMVEVEDFDESPEEITPPPRRASTKKKAKPWNDKEEEALAKAWIDVSEGPEAGNQHRSESFWKRILVRFEAHLGSTDRTVHQLNSKWKDMNGKISKFNAVYNNKLANRQSSQSEVDILSATIIEYRKLYKIKAFPHHAAWEILKDHPKWNAAPLMGAQHVQSAKRMKISDSKTYKTSLDAQFSNDFNEENEDYEELQIPQPKGKKLTSSSASSEQLLKIISVFNEFNKEDIEDKKRYRAEKLRLMKEEKEKKMLILDQELRMMQQKEKDKDLWFFLTPHDNFTGAVLNAVLARKREIAQRWGWD